MRTLEAREREREIITKGMPLGNNTSQLFANVYLNELDQFVKHVLKAKDYIRYVDDFVIFSASRSELVGYKIKINEFLKEKLNLTLHPDKSKIHILNQGIPFLGYRIFYYYKLPRKSNCYKFEKKLEELKVLYKEKQITREEVVESLEGWMAYAKYGNTYKYRKNLLRKFNRYFPIKNKSEIMRSKKIKNFFRKVYASKMEFSVQKTLMLVRKGMNIEEIAKERGVKIGTIWSHFENLIEHGQLAVWCILPRRKIATILQKIKYPSESLKEIKWRLHSNKISFNEVTCVRAYIRMKDKIAKRE